MGGHPVLASLSVGFLLMLAQVIETIDQLPDIVGNIGAYGLIGSAMAVAYKLIAKAQKDALLIREESFDGTTTNSSAMVEQYQKTLADERAQAQADRAFFNSEIDKLREERNLIHAELSQLKHEATLIKAQNYNLEKENAIMKFRLGDEA